MKVFLSSTAQDLEAYRRIADDTIQRLAQQSIAMERFGALPDTPVEECERLARESDVVVCIVAHRYGFVPEKGRGSITRREVEAARNRGRDVLVWIVDDNYPWTGKTEQDLLVDSDVLADPKRIAEVTEALTALLEFKSWLRTNFTPDIFTTPDDLRGKIAESLANYVIGKAVPSVSQNSISISRLQATSSHLFGRETELQILDKAWANPKTNVISFVAWGGVGKTTLVNHWLKKRMVRDNYRDADRVYGWSFFSQGASERSASADLFIDQALQWFGDPDPTLGSPWDKGERLARYIRQSRTLLILDGIEPLQHPPGPQEGYVKDAALETLLVELAAHQPGLCVISTRERISDLIEFEDSTVLQHDLEQLSPQAGAQIFRSLKVKGDDSELEGAAKELGGHAFSLTLLGSYLDEVLDGDIQRRKEIENLFEDTRYGDAAQRMIAAYEKWLGEGMEIAILRLLGLFDRPADPSSMNALCNAPTISRLTEPLQEFNGREWNQAVAKLRRIKLLDEASLEDLGMLYAHPLVREYFKQQLKRDRPDAWREANNRLYEHFKNTTKEFPESIEEMSPLCSAVTHGCAAQRYEEALDQVYHRRIQRQNVFFNWYSLGAYGADLTALTGFFDKTWKEPVALLSDSSKGYVLNGVGVDLRSLGRLQEAVEPTKAGLEIAITREDWRNAGRSAMNLSGLFTTLGELPQALHVAQDAVRLADRSDEFTLRVLLRATVGGVLYFQGHIDKASAAFREAETLLQSRSPSAFLDSWTGYLYCELLLAQGQVQQVKDRAEKALEISKKNNWMSIIGLNFIGLGRAWLLGGQGSKSDRMKGAEFIEQGVIFLRRGGQRDRLSYGLLIRATLYRDTFDFENVLHDLAEVFRVATSSGMRLQLADYRLQLSWLELAQNSKDKARQQLATAKEMINDMGYHLRDKEVAELEAQLGSLT